MKKKMCVCVCVCVCVCIHLVCYTFKKINGKN